MPTFVAGIIFADGQAAAGCLARMQWLDAVPPFAHLPHPTRNAAGVSARRALFYRGAAGPQPAGVGKGGTGICVQCTMQR